MFGLNSTDCYFELTEDTKNEWKVEFKAGNNKTIFQSPQAYASKQSAENAIEKFKDEASKANTRLAA